MGFLGALVLVCLAASFFASLAEAALYSIGRARIETLRRQGHGSGAILAALRDNIDAPIAAILILNTSVNTGAAAWVGVLALERFGEGGLAWFTGFFALSILIFGELIPKNLGYKYANQAAPLVAWPIRVLVWVLWPLVKVSAAFTALFGSRARLAPVPEDDIISLATMSMQGGGIRTQEAKWVVNALHLDKLTARDIMTPALVVWRVSAEMPLSMAAPEAEVWRFSRIPVYAGSDDVHIVGVVERRRVFQELVTGGGERTIRELMSPPVFVDEELRAHALLDMFIKSRTHLFCVRKADGRWSGIVSLEDVLEALLGQEIVGEQDMFEDMQHAAREAERAHSLSAEIKEGGGVIERAVVAAGAGLAGRLLREAGLPREVVIGTIVRGGTVIVPHGETRLLPGDKVTLIGKKDDVQRALRGLTEPAALTEPMP
ncbi:MAG: DUF21 domain-containing protein [Elusimicrobia bacterium]|nr:DUF21 domain-containing protein [Elusimicrobiota bacterium]